LPEENPNLTEPGLVLRGFVERVGDRAPLVAADGTKYLGEVLTVEAIEAMARTVGYGTPVTIAVPAYWSEAQTTALREEFFAQPDLTRGGVPPALISDATAAVTTLRTNPAFPTDGVVALCDFGASGTSVTLFNAGSNFQQTGPPVRYTEFSGDAIDQLVLNHVRSAGSDATTADLAGTARIGAQSRLLGESRRAKEQLSAAAAATVAAGSGDGVRLSRTDFEQLISEPLHRFIGAVENTLGRNGIQRSRLAAVAAVGGGASIPLIAARLSDRLRVPIHIAPQPAFSAAVGSAVLGDQQQAGAGVATAASPILENPTEVVETARATQGNPALAWSQDAHDAAEPVPYMGPDMTGEYGREATGAGYAEGDRYAAAPASLPWYKRTALVLSVLGAGAAVLVAVLLALTLGHTKTNPVNTTPPNEPAPPQTSQTVTITGPDDSTTVTVLPPPPAPSSAPPETTTASPAPTTTTQAPTTTSAQPTTTQATTTAAPTTTRQRPQPPFPVPPFGR
jgi:hypothetical protein